MKDKNISVGIPTYEGGKSLIKTLKSLYSQEGFVYVKKVIVAVDGKKLSGAVVKEIKNPKLKVIYFSHRAGQAQRINDIFEYSDSEYLFLTNDDVLLKKDFLNVLHDSLLTKADMYCARVRPLLQKTFVEKSLSMRDEMVEVIADHFQNGMNILRCNGRGIVLSKKLYKKISLPKVLWNNDAYLYIRAVELRAKIEYLPAAVVQYRLPKNIKEYLKQHGKFAYSKNEVGKYVPKKIDTYYNFPRTTIVNVYLSMLFSHPFSMLSYGILYMVAYLLKDKYKPKNIGFWESDLSTKSI